MGILNVKALKDWILLRAVNHMLATEKGYFMDARLGPVIQGELDKLKTSVSEINGNLTKTSYHIENYDIAWIQFTSAYGNRVIKTGTGLHVFNCTVNIPVKIPDRTNMFTIDSRLNGFILITQPFSGKSYPVQIIGGNATSWGTIEACNNCIMHGVLA